MSMTDSLKTYILNKVLSIGLPVCTILGSWYFLGYSELQWQFVILVLMASGYTHFLIGFVYQWKAFFRKPDTLRHIATFFVLTVFAVVIVEMIVVASGYAVGLFVGFIYFLLHGLFNEQTLLKREGGVDMSLLSISSVMMFLFSLLTYSVPDPTALFDRTLTFIPVDAFVMNLIFADLIFGLSFFTYVFWGGVITSFLLLLFTWWKEKNTPLTIFLLVVYALILLGVVVWGAPPYIYVYFTVVGYHLVTWFIFYFGEFKKRASNQLRNFLLLHVIVASPFVLALFLFFAGEKSAFVLTMIDYKYYVYATFIHITTSFMNDEWFKISQTKFFSLFERKPLQ